MFDRDKWQEIWFSIRKHKLRTFLTALGVWWGIFMLIFLMGAGKGLDNGINRLFGSVAKNSVYFYSWKTSKPYDGYKAGRYIQLDMDDIEALNNSMGHKIEYLAPRLNVWSPKIAKNGMNYDLEVRGGIPDVANIDAIEQYSGRFLNELDIKDRRKIAVIGKHSAEMMFEDMPLDSVVGQYLNIRGSEFIIVGVFKSTIREMNQAKEEEESIYIPLTTAQQLINMRSGIHSIACTIDPAYDIYKAEDEVLAILKQRHHVDPEDERGIDSSNLAQEFAEIQGLLTGINLLTWIVGIGSLMAGVIGVGNIMLIVVKERTREIGVRKALGATPREIISMVILESVSITTVAGYFGLLSGTGIIALFNFALGDSGLEFYANPQVTPGVVLGSLVILIIAGFLSGLVPARQAAQVDPVVALKDE
jgi:putative ABC transport system permease protein